MSVGEDEESGQIFAMDGDTTTTRYPEYRLLEHPLDNPREGFWINIDYYSHTPLLVLQFEFRSSKIDLASDSLTTEEELYDSEGPKIGLIGRVYCIWKCPTFECYCMTQTMNKIIKFNKQTQR